MRKQHITLTQADKQFLHHLLRKGSLKAITYKRATALLELHRGKTLTEVSQTLSVSYPAVLAWRDRYLSAGLNLALHDQPRSGRPAVIDGAQRAKITALACSTPPQGHARWTLRLLADRAVELGYCESLSHTATRKILKKTNCSRTSRSSGASGRSTPVSSRAWSRFLIFMPSLMTSSIRRSAQIPAPVS
jgi:putative transposase